MITYIMGIDLAKLDHNWMAVVKYKNGVVDTIWHTAWPSTKDTVAEVMAVSSDYPAIKKDNASGIINE
jgi:hypothetical protein